MTDLHRGYLFGDLLLLGSLNLPFDGTAAWWPFHFPELQAIWSGKFVVSSGRHINTQSPTLDGARIPTEAPRREVDEVFLIHAGGFARDHFPVLLVVPRAGQGVVI